MTIHKAKWLIVGLACLALWPAHASAQDKNAETGADSVTGSDPATGPDPDCLKRYRFQPRLRKEKCATPVTETSEEAAVESVGLPDKLRAGGAAYDREDYATALREWRPLAE